MSAPTCSELRERRQALRDQIWMHGPEHFDMGTWVQQGGSWGWLTSEQAAAMISAGKVDLGGCGTTGCLFGHAVATARHLRTLDDARDYFGLGLPGEIADLHEIFFPAGWMCIRLSDGTRLYDRKNHYCYDEGEGLAVAEWKTVLDYLDDLIKSTDCPEDGAP